MAARIQFDSQLMAEDVAEKGWTTREFAERAGVTDMTVIRFLRGERQTPKSAKKMARALRKPIRRYLISSRSREAVAS